LEAGEQPSIQLAKECEYFVAVRTTLARVSIHVHEHDRAILSTRRMTSRNCSCARRMVVGD